MKKNITLSITTPEELSTFCHELSKHIKISASGLKSSLAKMHGFSHVSSFVNALATTPSFKTGMTSLEWLNDFELNSKDDSTWNSRAKSLLFFMLNCINHSRDVKHDQFTVDEIFNISTPQQIIKAACIAHQKSKNDAFKDYIEVYINALPSGNFDVILNNHLKGEQINSSPVFNDQIGYLTMQIEPYLRNKLDWKLY